MLYEDSQIPAFQKLADALHVHGSKLALQIFHPEYDVQGVGRLIMGANMARKADADAQAAGNEEECQKQTALAEKTTKEAYAKLRHDMQHFVDEATVEQLSQIRQSIANCAKRAETAGVDAIQNRRYISCILNAENGDEATIFLKEAADPKKVAVVGAGIAGLEAARVAAKRGHQVTLFEKGDKIGGQIHLAAVPPRS